MRRPHGIGHTQGRGESQDERGPQAARHPAAESGPHLDCRGGRAGADTSAAESGDRDPALAERGVLGALRLEAGVITIQRLASLMIPGIHSGQIPCVLYSSSSVESSVTAIDGTDRGR